MEIEKKAGEKGKRREKRFEKQREEAERNRKKNRMKDWLCKRKLSDGDASGMERDVKDVSQNLAEIVGSVNLEKLEDSNQEPVNVGGQNSRRGKSGVLGNKEVGRSS